ncbi:MAG: beta-ketoacyl-[acyl-carrier-protein] synthase family protein [Pirellulaceae bacterium]|nr:beta-ketoacyl-[acyl-carrier-protein] synthase family protein [Pirellulaceae bacterium]
MNNLPADLSSLFATPASRLPDDQRVVLTGVGLTAPNGNNLVEYRENLLAGVSGVEPYEIRYFGKTIAGICHFDAKKYQSRKDIRRGTRAGSIGVYCAHEALADAGLERENLTVERVGVYVGITEHGNVETENEVYEISQFDYDTSCWSHHHNPRTVANNPAGEISLNLGLTGPHYTVGAACAAGNAGLIQALQMLRLHECDLAIAGGVSESIHTFGIFASFNSQGALATHDDPTKASRPFDKNRNGIVVSEGGCLYTLERLSDAKKRNAKIYGEIVGYAMNTDATDFVLPNAERQADCLRLALKKANLAPEEIDLISTHATATPSGDTQESRAINEVFGGCPTTYVNNTKSYIGHCMGAAGALELAGNLGSFDDQLCHPTINVDDLDPECAIKNLVLGDPKKIEKVEYILNMSFGMLGTNSVVIVQKMSG